MDINRILANIVVNETGCWIWQRSTNSAGYGQLTENKKYWLAHRYAYTCANGEIPDSLLLRHSCHTTKCCNPEHLSQGTNKDNYHDSADKHKEAQKKRRSKWSVNGKDFGTCREVVEHYGLSMNTVIKYTVNGVFDVDSYRKACYTARVRPKI